jgi:peptidoglycan/xylan/chitin deacetylase (PgdA/CDA1 family)
MGIVYRTTQLEIGRRNKSEKELEMTKLPKEVSKQIEKSTTFSATFRIPILVYHYVEIVTDKKDTIRKSLATPPGVLDKQIQSLQDAGYTFLTPADVGDMLDGKKPIPQKAVILSFDDGYRDLYTDVLPILQKHHVKAVAYIVPGFLDKLNYLYSWQLQDIFHTGLVEIGAHTIHHMYLRGASPTVAANEIITSKKMLEEKLHTPIVSFAYPYGAFDNQSIDLVKTAGFTTAVSTIGGNTVNELNRFFLFRIHPGYDYGPSFISLIERPWPHKS